MQTILAAMSGGVDSAVAALLLKEKGYAVSGGTMALYRQAPDGACGSPADAADARAVCERLGIPHHLLDFSEAFRREVIARFVDGYRAGATPNPCIDCNRRMKFGLFWEKALEMGFDAVATGHYARVERDEKTGRYLLKKARDPAKDQSYVLYMLPQETLARVVFPLGEMTKEKVRALAAEAGLENAQKPDSQDICFVPGGDYAAFLEMAAGAPAPGRFVTTDGRDLGCHRGLWRYTIGQRKGLGLSLPAPLYVVDKNAADNTVVLGRPEELLASGALIGDVNLIAVGCLTGPMRVTACTRYHQPPVPATVFPTGENTLRLTFDRPHRAVTPGQAAVFYDGDTVVGGGTILRAL